MMNHQKNILIVKADGEKEYFDPQKLEISLLRSGASGLVVDSILEAVQREIKPGMSTEHIYRYAFSFLGKKSRPLAVNYSIRRSVMEMGPSGFPFERLISEIFKIKGYTTTVGRKITGKCTEHEIDVLAYDEKELHLVEAKFHNQLGLQTDTKVALYVKARYDDLKDTEIVFNGQKRKMTEGWLFTNTKFTRGATQYASCANVKLVGWNYPHNGNLNDLIRETNLHPLTALTTLSKAEKLLLMEADIVLLKTIKQDESLLNPLKLSENRRKKVLEEIRLICVGH